MNICTHTGQSSFVYVYICNVLINLTAKYRGGSTFGLDRSSTLFIKFLKGAVHKAAMFLAPLKVERPQTTAVKLIYVMHML
jgi:hypothetical protein